MNVGAIQATVDVRQIGIEVFNIEITPHAEVVVALQLDIHLAGGGRIFDDCAIITECRVHQIRINTAEQLLRILVDKVGKQLVDWAFTRVSTGGQLPAITPPVIAELTIHIKRQTAINS